MHSRLIINADDFGLTTGINRAVWELHQAGALTSATLMANGHAFEDAVAVAHANPTLAVGCHITLVDGAPTAEPHTIPTLLGRGGRVFRASLLDFARALFRGEIHEDDIEREAFAQVQKLQRAGIEVTHLDTHKHTHLFPAIARPLLKLAQSISIRAIRNPFEPKWCRQLGQANLVRRMQMYFLSNLQDKFQQISQISDGQVATTDGTIGISATGQLSRENLAEILAAIPEGGVLELCCHPGYNDAELATVSTRLRATRDIEFGALMQVVRERMSRPNAPELIQYGDLADRLSARVATHGATQ